MIEISTKVDNTSKLEQQLDKFEEYLEKFALDTETEMKRSINTGAKTGRIYTRRGVKHVASAPGQSPANDSSNLYNSISTRKVRKGLVEVVIGALYALPLEYGTSRMKARPFILPALFKVAKKVEKVFEVLFK